MSAYSSFHLQFRLCLIQLGIEVIVGLGEGPILALSVTELRIEFAVLRLELALGGSEGTDHYLILCHLGRGLIELLLDLVQLAADIRLKEGD